MEYNMDRFKNQINSEFLYSSLETLISLIKASPDKSEKFINYLSDVYRFKLDNRNEELIEIKNEFEITRKYLYLLNTRYENSIVFTSDIPDESERMQIIPGTLQSLLDDILSRNIISTKQTFNINAIIKDRLLCLKYKQNPRLMLYKKDDNQIQYIEKAISYFTDKKITKENIDGMEQIIIPLLEIKERI
jgi:LytS/YehU family sensor histidine kinase